MILLHVTWLTTTRVLLTCAWLSTCVSLSTCSETTLRTCAWMAMRMDVRASGMVTEGVCESIQALDHVETLCVSTQNRHCWRVSDYSLKHPRVFFFVCMSLGGWLICGLNILSFVLQGFGTSHIRTTPVATARLREAWEDGLCGLNSLTQSV